MRILRALALKIALAVALHAAPAPAISLPDIFADPEMQSLQISPTGRYLTWLAPKNQRMNLAILDRESKQLRWLTDMKVESVVSYVGRNQTGSSSRNSTAGGSNTVCSPVIRTDVTLSSSIS